MNIISRFTKIAGLGAILAASILAGCSRQPVQTYSPAQASLPPQVAELGCPVQSAADLQRIFTGVNGVDGLRRPLNDRGVPVDSSGNCLSTAPVPEVYSAAVDPIYVNVLYSRYHYSYYYNPMYVHVYAAPGVIYRAHTVPTGHVNVQTVAPAGRTIAVPAGNTTTVRPGAPAAHAVAPTPASVAPPKASAPTATFNRPAAAPAPTSVAPPSASAPTTTFNRPTAAHAPASVAPPSASAPTATFNRPSASAPMHSFAPPRASAPTHTFSRPGHR
jgi:hypothetical protein